MRAEPSYYELSRLMKHSDAVLNQDAFKRKITRRPKSKSNNRVSRQRGKKR